ncbi:hypothetical protein MKW98_031051 [Papaver atlanticum]|uniref:Uncharacterized protein n=1 Tax=Papaver atlanticum TaxID=357466 RepID=A0AAD4SUV3_9MAGN|nr:hypothetical protein MKW98_031051 [Papaver atlanticum]
MMNTGVVDNAFRPLDLSNFPPWHITVTVAGGETRHINIPYPMGNNVIGLPLGLSVPEVIAGHYEVLLRMVQGMRDLITGIVRDLAQCQQDAARFCQSANHYYYELEELKLRMGGNVAPVSSSTKRKLHKVSSSRKRKLGTEKSGLSETQAVCIEKPEHLPPPKSNDRPSIPGLLVQESVIEENMDELDDLPRCEDVPTSAALVCSDVQTEKVESVAGVVPVRQSVDASTLCTTAKCLTVDSTTVTISNSIDITPPLVASANVPGQGEDEGFEYDVPTEKVASVTGVMLVEEPVDASMTSTSANCLTADCTILTISTPIDITPTRIGDEWFEDVENMKSDGLPLASVKRSGSEDVPTSGASLICSKVKTEKVESVERALVVWKPVDATMTSTSANCQTGNCTALAISTPTDITLPLIVSTSVPSEVGDEWFEYVDSFRIPKVYADLYKKIFSKYGHIATKKVIRSNDDILHVCVTSLMKIVSAMETIRGVDLSVKLIESWEGDIGDAETLQFNIKWLRGIFNALKNSWKSSFKMDKEVEIREQVLDATQVKYAGLCLRKDELESELLKVKMDIRKFEAQISSERETIQLRPYCRLFFTFRAVQGVSLCFQPAHMTNNEIRPLDLGNFPPWNVIVTLAGGETRQINIPHPLGNPVIGLPLCERQAVCIEKSEHLPPPISNDTPSNPCLLVQESVIEENMDESDVLPRREDVPGSAALVCSDVQTEKVESFTGVVPVGESVDASVTCTSANCLTVDSTTLPISNSIDITPTLAASTNVSGQVEDEGFEYAENLKLDDLPLTSVKHSQGEDVTTDVRTEQVASIAGTSTSANCLTVDCTTLTISTPTDIIPSLVESTSVSSRVGDEWFECVENFKIPKVYADLYKKIFSKYGHMATKKVIKSNDDIILVCVTSLMKIASTMETIRGVDLSAVLLESWEGDIRDAETLQFNIKWLHEMLGRLQNSWNLSLSIDEEEVESHEQVLDAEQVKYVGLNSRKDELETELLAVKISIRKSEEKISSEREAIRKKMVMRYIFLFEPVLGNLFS